MQAKKKNTLRATLQYTLFLAFSLFAKPGFACYTPPDEQDVTPAELLANSRDVALARVVAAEPLALGNVRYTFEVIQRFAGQERHTFELLGDASNDKWDDLTFDEHTDPRFWGRGGRSSSSADCQIHPTFSVGKAYLIFLDEPYTRKSFELINQIIGDSRARDQWLTYVQRHFGFVYRPPKKAADPWGWDSKANRPPVKD
jgi:hypothetical protein